MRTTTSITAASIAVLALALSGCSSDDGGDDKAAPKPKKTAEKQQTEPKHTRSPSPSRTSTSPSASPSRRTASPSPTRTRTQPSATPTRAPSPSRTRSAPSGPSGAQGAWYYPVRTPDGQAISMRVTGTSWTISYKGNSCSGTINSGMAIRATCGGETKGGTAVLGGGGQKLTYNWNGGQPDRFQRTPPPAS